MSADQLAAFWLSASDFLMREAGVEGEQADNIRILSNHSRQNLNPDEYETASRILSLAGYPVTSTEGKANTSNSNPEGETDVVEAEPIRRAAPRYPPEVAARADIQRAFVAVKFDVSPQGKTENIRILYSLPFSNFGRETVKAVEKWRYSPMKVGGEAVWQRDVVSLIDFTM